MMDKIDSTVYRRVYDVSEHCNMELFARSLLSTYKQAQGFGYFEFKRSEDLETHKNVIVMDKVSHACMHPEPKNMGAV